VDCSLAIVRTTVAGRKGTLIDGLIGNDLILYDNNVPKTSRVDRVGPTSLVVVRLVGRNELWRKTKA
jgi:hypothetical protein